MDRASASAILRRMTISSPLRWGILGAANIARKNWRAIANTGNGTVVAVASRELTRSRKFIADCQAEAPMATPPRALGSYEELIAAPDLDAVYIPLPTGLRKEWVIRAAEAGKHIVCEKPCAPTVVDLREMLDACRRHRVQFLDGVMFMHSRRLASMKEAITGENGIGPLKRIESTFSFPSDSDFFRSNIRAHSALEPLGCLGDLGWYCVRFTLWAMEGRLPRQVTGRLLTELGRADSPSPVPAEFSGELLFDGGVSASFYCSFITALQQWAHVIGTEGSLRVDDFVLPFSGSEMAFEVGQADFQARGCDFKMEKGTRRVTVPEHSHGHATAQETNLFRSFADQVRSGRLNDVWPDLALKTQQVANACLESALAGGHPVNLVETEAPASSGS
jgi:predicted dehydrogenase